MNNQKDNKRVNTEGVYEAIFSSAYMFKTRKTYGSFEKAIKALMKRKAITKLGFDENECQKYFSIALKVVDDLLEFENTYIQSNHAGKSPPGGLIQKP